MELGISSLDSAIRWYIDYMSNGEGHLCDPDIKECISKNYFPHLKYYYDSSNIKDFISIDNYKDIVVPIDKKITHINNLPNKIVVETRVEEKKSDDFSFLKNELDKKNITLEKVIDIEFFEYLKSHENYLIHLDDSIEDKLKGYSDKTGPMSNISHKGLVRKIYESEFKEFEEVLFGNDPAKFYDILDKNLKKIDNRCFSAFLDTEKIHIQLAICTYETIKEVPVLAYFGYGNYYPFISCMKNKNKRYARFSQLNHGDKIDGRYYIEQIMKSGDSKDEEIKNIINDCQLGYYDYFDKNLSFASRRDQYIAKNGEGNEFPELVDRLIMLEPIIRTKSSALVAYNYPFYGE